MVVVMKNDDFRDAVSEIIQSDYFPPSERIGLTGKTNKTLTDFHHRITSETTIQLTQTFEQIAKSATHKQLSIYQPTSTSTEGSDTNNGALAVVELRNTLFFPISTTAVATTAKSSDPLKTMFPPLPRERHRKCSLKQTSLSTDGNRTVFVQHVPEKRMKSSSSSNNKEINPSATRFPKKHRTGSRHKNCYNNGQTELHWEGSTMDMTNIDDHSSVTDLDATTIDSYSIRSELRKAKIATQKTQRRILSIGTSVEKEQDILLPVATPHIYQLPLESDREVTATRLIQQMQNKHQVLRVGRRQHSSDSIKKRSLKSPNNKIRSLRSKLRASHQSTIGM
jgi:hypothetical protein